MATGVMGRQKVRPINRTRERIFFGGMSLLMAACVLLGLRMTYFPLGTKPVAPSSWVIIVHDSSFSLYLLLFLTQIALVSARKMQWHKQLGLWSTGSLHHASLGVFTAMRTPPQSRRRPTVGIRLRPLQLLARLVMGAVRCGRYRPQPQPRKPDVTSLPST